MTPRWPQLVQYKAEVRGLKPLLDALALTEKANIWLAKSGYEYAKALNAWIEHSKERHEWERARASNANARPRKVMH